MRLYHMHAWCQRRAAPAAGVVGACEPLSGFLLLTAELSLQHLPLPLWNLVSLPHSQLDEFGQEQNYGFIVVFSFNILKAHCYGHLVLPGGAAVSLIVRCFSLRAFLFT